MSRKEGWTERQRRYQGKPLVELGLPKRPVPYQRSRPIKRGFRQQKNICRGFEEAYGLEKSDIYSNASCLSSRSRTSGRDSPACR